MSNLIYVLRHGETADFDFESALSKHGQMQTKRICKYLIENDVTKVYSSPQKRALESVAYLKQNGLQVTVDSRLRDFIATNNRMDNYRRVIKTSLQNPYLSNCGGEKIADVIERLNNFMSECYDVKCNKKSIVISTHGVCASILVSPFLNDNIVDIWERMKTPDLYCIFLEPKKVMKIDIS